jgi:HD-GYP domain-containing protein (c-di-GMP phosphodiesterase class II)
MRGTIRQFMETSAALAAEKRLDKLLYQVLRDTADAARARRACLYLVVGEALQRAALQSRDADTDPVHLPERLHLDDDTDHACLRAARSRSTVLAALADGTGGMLLCVPLVTREAELVGVLLLELDAGHVSSGGGRDPLVAFVESLSGAAAVAIETRHLIKAQKDLLDALIEIVAAAIDAKSPYTGGHCQRVPVLAEMLADAACEARDGRFRDFSLDAEQREALKIAAWLHDCGKVTTPEYVVDKAVKLETLYNRLHEIRMRFEVLKRDAEIACWKAVATGARREECLRALERTWRMLDEEFAFIAECNNGGEAMSEESISRVRQIASRTWVRTLDDRVGLSENERRRRVTLVAPPAIEYLLADKAEHIVPRPADEVMPADNPWGFKLEVPQHKFNLGEIYNLCVARGTLTEEERFVINDHIVQTIIMLSKLPFPRHLRHVPEVAGGHHERIDGRGYPKRLKGEQMSVPARIIAIADIYEALTAADRPYKRGKTLSESLQIMRAMAVNRHIDADLYNLFLESGSFRRYADRFLAARQIDEVDIAALRV